MNPRHHRHNNYYAYLGRCKCNRCYEQRQIDAHRAQVEMQKAKAKAKVIRRERAGMFTGLVIAIIFFGCMINSCIDSCMGVFN